MTATKRKPKPITANPLFPFVTALWFATFFGLGSFAVAPALLEGPVVALGIPALVPAAAPPLGFTARVMFALVMMGAGAFAGYVAGRMLGREKVAAPVRMRGFGKSDNAQAAAQVRRPINAAADLGAPLDAPADDEMPLRRRALSLDPELALDAEAQAAPMPETAPLPGDMPWETGLEANHQADGAADPSDHAASVADPLAFEVLLDEANAAEHQRHTDAEPMFAAPTPDTEPLHAERLHETAPVEEYAPVQISVAVPAPAPFLQAQAAKATPIDRAPLESLGLVQLIERLALAISRRSLPVEQPEPFGVSAPEFVVSTPPEQASPPRFATAPVAEPDAEEPFGASVSTSASPERVVQLRPTALQPVPQAGDEMAAPGTDDEDEDLGLDRFLRMSPLLASKPVPEAGAIPSDNDAVPEPDVAEDRYPSLLEMGPVAIRREPLRIDDHEFDEAGDSEDFEPVVVFPGQESAVQAGPAAARSTRPFERPSIMPLPGSPLASPGRAAPSAQDIDADNGSMATLPVSIPDAEEADRALRAALATLQRMTAQG